MLRGVAIAAVVVVASLAGIGVASANEAPLAAAGLDQEVSQGATVYLDAGGSVDPDGTIEQYRWQIVAPDGTVVTPRCGSCEQTSFRARQNGTYNVTVTVTDDDGAARSDTLYVTATPSEPPSVTVDGPTDTDAGTTATFDAVVDAGDYELSELVWERNGTEIARQSLNGTSATATLNRSLSPGSAEITATATDRIGATGTDTHVVDVTRPASSTSSGGGPSGRSTDLYRPVGDPDGAYRLRLTSDGTVLGPGSGTLFDEDAVERLQNKPGVDITESYAGWNRKTRALEITNEKLKEDIDKDAGCMGCGFHDSTSYHVTPESSRYRNDQSESAGSTDRSNSVSQITESVPDILGSSSTDSNIGSAAPESTGKDAESSTDTGSAPEKDSDNETPESSAINDAVDAISDTLAGSDRASTSDSTIISSGNSDGRDDDASNTDPSGGYGWLP